MDLVTYEFENIPASALDVLEGICPISPPVNSLKITQDRVKEKKFFNDNKIPCAKTLNLKNDIDLKVIKKKVSYPAIIKTSRLGYDGKGQFTINNHSDLLKSWSILNKTNCVIEEKINIKKEISILGARSPDGEIKIIIHHLEIYIKIIFLI